jgi:hypothetical protein
MANQDERRWHPRYVLHACAELAGDDSLTLRVRNISVTGVLLWADGRNLAQFPVGSDQDVVIFNPDDPSLQVSLRARVVRHDVPLRSIALIWKDAEAIADVGRLLNVLHK